MFFIRREMLRDLAENRSERMCVVFYGPVPRAAFHSWKEKKKRCLDAGANREHLHVLVASLVSLISLLEIRKLKYCPSFLLLSALDITSPPIMSCPKEPARGRTADGATWSHDYSSDCPVTGEGDGVNSPATDMPRTKNAIAHFRTHRTATHCVLVGHNHACTALDPVHAQFFFLCPHRTGLRVLVYHVFKCWQSHLLT